MICVFYTIFFFGFINIIIDKYLFNIFIDNLLYICISAWRLTEGLIRGWGWGEAGYPKRQTNWVFQNIYNLIYLYVCICINIHASPFWFHLLFQHVAGSLFFATDASENCEKTTLRVLFRRKFVCSGFVCHTMSDSGYSWRQRNSKKHACNRATQGIWVTTNVAL